MKNSIYKKYCGQKLPEDFQKRAEGFASMSDTVQEEMFRAGFYCGLHIKEIFTDKDNPDKDDPDKLTDDVMNDWKEMED